MTEVQRRTGHPHCVNGIDAAGGDGSSKIPSYMSASMRASMGNAPLGAGMPLTQVVRAGWLLARTGVISP